MYDSKILPLHAQILHLGRLRTWAKVVCCMGSLEHLVARLAPSKSPSNLNFPIFKLHTDFINFGTFPNTS
jgi:hypothetical protein